MNKISDHNLIHKDVLEITETEIEDKIYNLRQRHSADNVFYSKGVQRGYTEQQKIWQNKKKRKNIPHDVWSKEKNLKQV